MLHYGNYIKCNIMEVTVYGHVTEIITEITL